MLRFVHKWVVKPIHRAGTHYLCLIGAGVFGLFWPSESVQRVTFGNIPLYFWLGSLMAGGLLCSIGRWRRTMGIKLLGLILILASLGTYQLALLSLLPYSGGAFFFTLTLTALFIGRFRQLRTRRNAELALRRGAAGGGSVVVENNGDYLALPGTRRRWSYRGPLAR